MQAVVEQEIALTLPVYLLEFAKSIPVGVTYIPRQNIKRAHTRCLHLLFLQVAPQAFERGGRKLAPCFVENTVCKKVKIARSSHFEPYNILDILFEIFN